MAVKKKAKPEVFASKKALAKHEKGENASMSAMEKKMGEKDMVKKMKSMKKKSK